MKLLKLLVQRGINLNLQSHGTDAIHWAIADEDSALLFDFLLENHADLNTKDILGDYSIHTAIAWNKLDFVKKLIEHHVQLDVRDAHGLTPLQRVIAVGRAHIISYLTHHL
ncbi:MAG: ankyrin repeat domain-containing protein [Bdellovibrionia bacterium]